MGIFLNLIPGEIIDPKHRCKKCKGKKVVNEAKILEVNLNLAVFLIHFALALTNP